MARKTSTQSEVEANTVVDTAAINNELAARVNVLENKRKRVSEEYKREKKVTVQGSPMYRPYFGNTMPIIINSVAVYVPLDGQQYEIPETFAAVFKDRISRIDEQINMRKQMSAVSENVESYAGEKSLIKRV